MFKYLGVWKKDERKCTFGVDDRKRKRNWWGGGGMNGVYEQSEW